MTTLICLKADLKEEGLWREERLLAERCKRENGRILWELDFGFQTAPVAFDDPALFFSLSLAIQQFSKAFEADFSEISEGVVLYRGDLNIQEKILWSGSLKDHYEEWLEQINGEDLLHYQRLFSFNVIAEYLHRLASFLPDSLKPICSFHVPQNLSRISVAQLLSKERFTHLSVEPVQKEASVGLILPPDEILTPANLKKCDQLCLHLEKENLFFKIIPEAFLNEEWHGLETLIAIDSLVTPQGRRLLQGFMAASGDVRLF
jgi:hypothetical protein